MGLRHGERATKDWHQTTWRQIAPVFGQPELRQITSSKIQAWVRDQEAAGTHPKTIRSRFAFLQSILVAKTGSSAIRDGLIDRNPCHGVDLPFVPRREVTIFEPEEYQALLETIHVFWRPLVMLCAEIGMRWGELMGLRVRDFEPDFRAVTVEWTIVQTRVANTGNGTPFEWKPWPKGRKPRRIALTPEARAVLRHLIAERGLNAEDRVFSMPTSVPRPRRLMVILTAEVLANAGTFAGSNNIAYRHGTIGGYQTGRCRCLLCKQASADYRYSRLPSAHDDINGAPVRTEAWPCGLPIDRTFFFDCVWLPAIEQAGVPRRRFHDLRASNVSWLLAMGVDLPTVMEHAGHEGHDTTLRYQKALSDADDKILTAMAQLRERSAGGRGEQSQS